MANEARRGLLLAFAAVLMMGSDVSAAQAPKVLARGDVLSGQLNAMRSRVDGKRVSTFQIVSEPRRLPPPGGLCNLETGPQTFQLVTAMTSRPRSSRSCSAKRSRFGWGRSAVPIRRGRSAKRSSAAGA